MFCGWSYGSYHLYIFWKYVILAKRFMKLSLTVFLKWSKYNFHIKIYKETSLHNTCRWIMILVLCILSDGDSYLYKVSWKYSERLQSYEAKNISMPKNLKGLYAVKLISGGTICNWQTDGRRDRRTEHSQLWENKMSTLGRRWGREERDIMLTNQLLWGKEENMMMMLMMMTMMMIMKKKKMRKKKQCIGLLRA